MSVVEKTKELEKAKNNARSLSSNINKYHLSFLGSSQNEYHTYYYYKDDEGNYWYENDYDCDMEEKEKEKKRRRLTVRRGVI